MLASHDYVGRNVRLMNAILSSVSAREEGVGVDFHLDELRELRATEQDLMYFHDTLTAEEIQWLKEVVPIHF